MALLIWPDGLDDVWAKSAEKGQNGRPESLVVHTRNVLERLADIIRLRPELPKQIGFPELWNCLFWACFLHDLGKSANGFQEMLRTGKRWPHRHEVLSLAFLDWIAGVQSEDDPLWIAAAIVSHHKDAEEILLAYNERTDPDGKLLANILNGIDEATLNSLWNWLSEYQYQWIQELNLQEMEIKHSNLQQRNEAIHSFRNHGATAIRKWLIAYQRGIKKLNKSGELSLIIGTIALRGYITSSDHLASAHVGELPSSRIIGPQSLLDRWSQISGKPYSLYSHQSECIETRGSAVLMSPTGSGKTEAALLWAVAQAGKDLPVPRLYYMLPYQASMNAMYDRLNDDQKGSFPGQVGLEHSRSILAYYRRLLEDQSPAKAASSAKWLNNLARLNYYPVRVLSPYQILKGPYCLKGYETLFSDCFNAVFILDEVHAYEAKRLALIFSTIKFLRLNFEQDFL